MPDTDGPFLAHSWTGVRTGPVTVVLHGGGPGCHAASDFAAVLRARPHRRWLCVDLPGYGRSPARTGPRLAGAAHALAMLLDHLGLSEVDVLGQSLGGTVAFRLATEDPDRVRRLMVIGSQPAAQPGGIRGLRTDTGLGARARATYYGDGPTPAKMRTLMAELEWYDGTAVPQSTADDRYRASLATPAAVPTPEDLGATLGSITCPTLVVWGRHDPFAGPDYAAALADTLPRADLAVISHTAHHPQAERPDAVAALADAFLTGRN